MLSLVHPSKLRISLSEHGVGQRIWTGPYGLITLDSDWEGTGGESIEMIVENNSYKLYH